MTGINFDREKKKKIRENIKMKGNSQNKWINNLTNTTTVWKNNNNTMTMAPREMKNRIKDEFKRFNLGFSLTNGSF